MSKKTPLDRELYEKIKRRVKRDASKWPTETGNQKVEREYLRRGGAFVRRKSNSSSYSQSLSESVELARRGASVSRSDLKGIKFVRGPGKYKYTAILPNGRRVNFGDKSYEQYRDSVPRSQGGGLYSSKDHKNQARRKNYRTRHGGVRTKSGSAAFKRKYSPSWFSYNLLW